MKKHIYLDHAATTYIKKEVLSEMYPFLKEYYGNASSLYDLGRKSKEAIEQARTRVASATGSQPEEIYFTSCGTESDNWAIKGVAYANKTKGRHIITSAIEHPAILNSCWALQEEGFKITYLPVDKYGTILLDRLIESISEDTILISVMFANNEIGTIQPIKEIGEIAKKNNILFHTDAVQAVGSMDIDVNDYNIDLLSLSAHKFYGPKGIGALFIRNGTNIDSYLHGGSQELGKRGGTENVASIVGLGKAIEMAAKDVSQNSERMKNLRDKFISEVMHRIPDSELNGHPIQRLPGNANITFRSVNGGLLLSELNVKGIYASSGAACSCNSLQASHVLMAINLDVGNAFGALRFTFGEENTDEEIAQVVETLSQIIKRIRKFN